MLFGKAGYWLIVATRFVVGLRLRRPRSLVVVFLTPPVFAIGAGLALHFGHWPAERVASWTPAVHTVVGGASAFALGRLFRVTRDRRLRTASGGEG
jgi:hypothetical protein